MPSPSPTEQHSEDGWDALLTKAGGEVCAALGLGSHRVRSRPEKLPAGRLGAVIPLVGEVQVQLLLLGTNSSVRGLAEALLHYEDGDDPLTGDDVKDAFQELANQFAGLAKRHFPGHADLRLGLPVFVRGTVKPPPGVRCYVQDVSWGQITLTLGLIVMMD